MKKVLFLLQFLISGILFALPAEWDAYFYVEKNLRQYKAVPMKNNSPSFSDRREIKHRTVRFNDGMLDLDSVSPANMNRVVLVGKFISPEEKTCWIGMGGAAFSINLNGKMVYDFLDRGLGNDFQPVSGKDHIFEIKLKKGLNTFVINSFKTTWKLDYCYGKNRHNPWLLALTEQKNYRPKQAKLAHPPLFLTTSNGFQMVTIITEDPVPVGIDYREKGSQTWKRQWALAGDLVMRENSRIHRIILDDLLPDKNYEYRIVMLEPPAGMDGKRHALWTTRQYKEVVTPVKTLHRGKENNFKFAVFGDTQLSISETLRTVADRRTKLHKMFQQQVFQQADFLVHIGDLTSYAHDIEKDIFSNFFDHLSEKTDRSWLYIRGNHEANGLGSEAWYDYFTMPGGKTFYAFRRGETLFIVLDCGDFTVGTDKSYSGPIINQEYLMQKQQQFLEKLKNTPEFKSAKFRIVLSHSEPLSGAGAFSKRNREMMMPLLENTTSQGMIHLWIAGHIHTYSRANRGESVIRAVKPWKKYADNKSAVTFVTTDGPKNKSIQPDLSFLEVNVGENTITVTAFDENGVMLDKFVVKQSGEVENIFLNKAMKLFPIKKSE